MIDVYTYQPAQTQFHFNLEQTASQFEFFVCLKSRIMNYQTLKINHIETEVCFSNLASICAECLVQVQTLDLRSRVVRSALDFSHIRIGLYETAYTVNVFVGIG